MKKWLMLAFLPLLLAQQEAGAGIIGSQVDGPLGYTAVLNVQDNKVDITITFNTGLDLAPAKYLEQDNFSKPDARFPFSDVKSESVMRFYITDSDGGTDLEIINLQYYPNFANPNSLKLAEVDLDPTPRFVTNSPTTMIATYTFPAGSDLNPGDWSFTCMISNINLRLGQADDGCATEDDDGDYLYLAQLREISAIPLPNSFLLLGIGLMALGIPRRRGRLFR